jgi:hypothetical protein
MIVGSMIRARDANGRHGDPPSNGTDVDRDAAE